MAVPVVQIGPVGMVVNDWIVTMRMGVARRREHSWMLVGVMLIFVTMVMLVGHRLVNMHVRVTLN